MTQASDTTNNKQRERESASSYIAASAHTLPTGPVPFLRVSIFSGALHAFFSKTRNGREAQSQPDAPVLSFPNAYARTKFFA